MGLALDVGRGVVGDTFGGGICTAFSARLLVAITRFIALATTTSTAATALTAFTGCAIGALFLTAAILSNRGLAAGLQVCVHRHWFAFGVKTLALRAALAVSAAASPTASATAIASVATAFTAWATAFAANLVAALSIGSAFSGLATAAVAVTVAAIAGFTAFCSLGCRGWIGRCWRWLCCKKVLDPAEEALFCGHWWLGICGALWCSGSWLCCRGGRAWCGDRRGSIRQHTLDDGRLFVGRLLRTAGHRRWVFHLVSHLVAGFDVVQTRVVVFQALKLVVGCFQGLVGHQQHVDALFQFDLGHFRTLFVQQERCNVHWHLAQHRGRTVLKRLFLDDPQNLQSAGFGVTDVARTAATRARNGSTFAQRRAQALAAHFHQTKFADGAELHACTVLAQRVAQAVFHFAAVARLFHVDKVDNDQATQVTQAHLAGDFVGGFQVGAGGSLFDVAALDGAGRVHVHGYQGFGVVNDDCAAGWQLYRAGVSRFDLVLDLEAAEQRCVVTVTLHAGGVLGHHVGHELLGLLVHVVGVDQDVADVVVEVIADGAYHQRGLLIDQIGALATLGRAVYCRPQLQQVVQIPL